MDIFLVQLHSGVDSAQLYENANMKYSVLNDNFPERIPANWNETLPEAEF